MTTYAPASRGVVPRVFVDPRIRARRIAVKRSQGRRRLRRLVAISTLALVTAAAGVAAFSPLLDVDTVQVVGVSKERVPAIRAAADVSRGDPTLFVDTDAVAASVETLPWVANARVARELPGTVRITVTPRLVVGWARLADGTAELIDRRGIAVDRVPAPPAGLPRLTGQGARPAHGHIVPALAARAAAALSADVRASASTVDVVGGEVTVVLAAGPQIRLGDGRGLRAKARAAAAVLAARADAPPAYVDVSVPSAPATG